MNAIISCHDKKGLKDLAQGLAKEGVKIYSSGGTYRELKESGNAVEISSYTGFPEMPSGLVKTLHPKVHAGILADVKDEAQKRYMEENGIKAFDLVVVNLYPFEKAVAEGAGIEKARQNIDVGGVSLIEAAAKNFRRVAVVCNSKDYAKVLKEIKENGEVSSETRLKLAKKAFAYIADYLSAISGHFEGVKHEGL